MLLSGSAHSNGVTEVTVTFLVSALWDHGLHASSASVCGFDQPRFRYLFRHSDHLYPELKLMRIGESDYQKRVAGKRWLCFVVTHKTSPPRCRAFSDEPVMYVEPGCQSDNQGTLKEVCSPPPSRKTNMGALLKCLILFEHCKNPHITKEKTDKCDSCQTLPFHLRLNLISNMGMCINTMHTVGLCTFHNRNTHLAYYSGMVYWSCAYIMLYYTIFVI